MRKKVLRLLRLVPIALALSGVASAQTTGTIVGVVTDASTGKPVAGALVVATSPNLPGEQTAITDESGNYRLPLLPPGEYKLVVQFQGYKPAERTDIRLSSDKTLRANITATPEAVQLEEQVVRTGMAPVINVGSAESGQVVSKDFIANVPVGRGYENISLVAPAATGDFYGISFAGSQSPENLYVIDGQNVGDPVFGARTVAAGAANAPASLVANFYEEIDVKSGNFGAEYGRATGGVFNVVLKGGSNEFHGEVWGTLTPRNWIQPDGKAVGGAGEAVAYKITPKDGSVDYDVGFGIGGPIMKDKLWFYAGFAPVYTKTAYQRYLRMNSLDSGGNPIQNADGTFVQSTIPGTETKFSTDRTQYQYVGKLTFLASENHSITASAWGSTSERSNLSTNFYTGPMNGAPTTWFFDYSEPVFSVQAKYDAKFLEKKLLLEAMAGYYMQNQERTPGPGGGGADTPRMEWLDTRIVTDFEPAPGCTSVNACPVFGYNTGGPGGLYTRKTDRLSGKLTLSYLFSGLGFHNVKGGVDLERTGYTVEQFNSGGWYYRAVPDATHQFQIQAFRGYGHTTVNGTTDPANVTPSYSFNNESQSDSFAYFLQDSWTIQDTGVTLNAGVRLETQHSQNLTSNAQGLPNGFNITDNWQPRISAIWDFTGAGRGKLSGSWGRYYFAFPLRMGERAFGNEQQLVWRVYADTCPSWPASLANGGAGSFDTRNVSYTACSLVTSYGFRNTGSPYTPVDPKVQGQYVDEYGAAVEYEVLQDLSVGLVWDARRQGNVIEDMSSDDGNNYYIGNPGVDRNIYLPDGTFAGNSKFVTTTDPASGRAINIQFPSPKRSYDGVTVKMTKAFSRSWLAQASYTYSYLRGNYSGPFRPEDNQLDPGITAEYDLASLMANKYGFLPQDITHQLKLFGAYTWTLSPELNLRASGAYRGQSGTPVNALGAHPVYGASQAFIIPRGMGGRTPFFNQIDLGAGVEWKFSAPYAVRFGIDFFNVLNSQTVLLQDEDYTFDTVTPIPNAQCKNKDSTSKSNPATALQADCPDIPYLKTVDGRPATVNPNWGKAQRTAAAYQTPFTMRLNLSLSF